jgi:hypothetical protein
VRCSFDLVLNDGLKIRSSTHEFCNSSTHDCSDNHHPPSFPFYHLHHRKAGNHHTALQLRVKHSKLSFIKKNWNDCKFNVLALLYMYLILSQQTIPAIVSRPTTTGNGVLSSFSNVTPTGVSNPGSTVTAGAADNNVGATSSAGPIAGGVIGALIGLAAIGFLVSFVLVSLFSNLFPRHRY